MKKLLVANRGEIALRVIRAAKELGIKTVAVHSEADVHALHVKFADEDVCIGPGPSRDSYLNQERVLSAAIVTNADAIHPGYGFLSENSEFAEKCESSGITFVGPTAEMIRKMGDKALAKKTMKAAGVTTVPGGDEVVASAEAALDAAESYGYPVIIKAVAGGGGRGMRVVRDAGEMEKSFGVASNEALAAFGDGGVYLEKFIEGPRHIEVQLMGDGKGDVIHLFERDCSVQRRHQKLIEESPSPALTPEQRKRLCEQAARGAAHIAYRGAGTMEFLLDAKGNFYFMEMNTRIQVEHPVTEMITGVDLIQEQLLVASGARLSYRQSDLKINGHAMECRINAEDPEHGFRPSPGTISHLYLPGGPGVRIDHSVYAGYVIPPFYDSMIGKLICHARNRPETLARMRRALEEFVVEGVKTTVPLHQRILQTEAFQTGKVTTRWLEESELF